MATRRWGQALGWTVLVSAFAGTLVVANRPRPTRPTDRKPPGG